MAIELNSSMDQTNDPNKKNQDMTGQIQPPTPQQGGMGMGTNNQSQNQQKSQNQQQTQNQAQPQNPQKQPVGSGFTNLSKILGANQGQGQQLASRVGNVAQQQTGATQQAQQQTQQQVNQGMEAAKNLQTQGQNIQGQIGSASSAANLASMTPEQVANMQKVAQGQYGIEDINKALAEGMGNIAGYGSKAAQTGQMLQTEAGRSGLLGNLLRRPSGGSALASTLMQTEGQNTLSDVTRNTNQALSDIAAQNKVIGGYSGALTDLAKSGSDVSSKLKNIIGSKAEEFRKQQEDEAKGINNYRDTQIATLENKLANRQALSDEDRQLLGITGSTFGTAGQIAKNLGSLINKNSLNAADVVNADEASGFSNLAKIMGQTGGFGTSAGTVKEMEANKAGVKDIIEKQRAAIRDELMAQGGDVTGISDFGAGAKASMDQLGGLYKNLNETADATNALVRKIGEGSRTGAAVDGELPGLSINSGPWDYAVDNAKVAEQMKAANIAGDNQYAKSINEALATGDSSKLAAAQAALGGQVTGLRDRSQAANDRYAKTMEILKRFGVDQNY